MSFQLLLTVFKMIYLPILLILFQMMDSLTRSRITYTRRPTTLTASSSNDSSSSSNGTTRTKRQRTSSFAGSKYFRVNDHFDLLTEGRQEFHVCKVDGCDQRYKKETSSSHKRAHVDKHSEKEVTLFHNLPAEEKIMNILILIATAGLPYLVVENPLFRIVTGITMCKKTVKQKMISLYEQKRFCLKTKLSQSDCISVSMDLWSCSPKSNESYCCFIGHFLEVEVMRQVLIDFFPLPHPHTGSLLSEKLNEMLSYFDIQSKVVSITADGASNNRTAIQLLNSIRTIQQLSQVNYINCFCHVIHNVITHATESLSPTLVKCHELCRTIRKSGNLSQRVKCKCIELGLDCQKVLLDVSTRWNSLYLMLQRMLVIREALEFICDTQIALAPFSLTVAEWDDVEQTVIFLRPFYEVTCEMSRAAEFNYSLVIVYYRNLLKHCQEQIALDEENLLIAIAYERLVSYKWKIETESALFATTLDPFANRCLSDQERCSLGDKLRHIISCQPQSQPPFKSQTSRSALVVQNVDEVTKYLSVHQPDEDENIVKWWLANSRTFPGLSKLAKKYIIMRPSSVSVESTFSIASWTINPKRNRLSDESIQALMFLHHYFKGPFSLSD